MAESNQHIGDGRDHADPDAWYDYAVLNHADLPAADILWRGLVYPEGAGPGGVWSGVRFDFNGLTTDATRYPELTAAQLVYGADADYGYDALLDFGVDAIRYDPTKGVAIESGGFYSAALVRVQDNYFRLSKVQLKLTSGAIDAPCVESNNCSNVRFEQLIMENTGSGIIAKLRGAGSQLRNFLGILNTAATHGMQVNNDFADTKVKYGALVRPTGHAAFGTGNAFTSEREDFEMTGMAMFGFAAACDVANDNPNSDYNFADTATNLPGANSVGTLAIADQFIGPDGTDWTPKIAAALKDAGPTGDADVTVDFRGTPRPQNTNFDIGFYERVAGAALAIDSLAQSVALDGAALAQDHQLGGADLAQAVALDGATLQQDHRIAAAGLVQETALDQASLLQAHLLAIADLVQLVDLEGNGLGGGHALSVDGLAQLVSLGGAALTQTHLLQPADLAQLTAIEAVALLQTHLLAVEDLVHQAALSGAALQQTHLLAILDLVQAVALEAGGVSLFAVPDGLKLTIGDAPLLATALADAPLLATAISDELLYA